MNKLNTVVFFPKGLSLPPQELRRWSRYHQLWIACCLTAMAAGTGLVCLLLTAAAYPPLSMIKVFQLYLSQPLVLGLNLLPPVLLTWLFYLLLGRAWAGFLLGAVPTVGLALGNYYKIQLRGDPLLASDLLLAGEAGGIVGRYTLELTWVVAVSLSCLVLGVLFALFLLPRGVGNVGVRLAGVALAVLMGAGAYFGLYTRDGLYANTEKLQVINPWNHAEVYCGNGVLYSFLHSVREMFPAPPKGYDPAAAARVLAQYTDGVIPPDGQINVVGVMLEAFCDLTDLFPALADDPGVQAAYRPWHELEGEALSGDLLTNIFAGGTVDSEWSFLTGYSQHLPFRGATDSYVWYLRGQGYHTQGGHPGYGWFYNRQNINEYLGFQEYWFTENHYGRLVDPVQAAWHSDDILAREIAAGLEDVVAGGKPCFSFSVSYQNHGPYDGVDNGNHILSDRLVLTEESRNILNNYLAGISSTAVAMGDLRDRLEEMETPVVLVLFGDHKPWLGNGNSVYLELGETFDLATEEGFFNYYATPYLIWANSAARAMLDGDFTGPGGDFSPCFLMNRVFDLCGWEGPAFMQYADTLRQITPLVHQTGRYLEGGVLSDQLSGQSQALLEEFLQVQYYRQQEEKPAAAP